MKHPLYLLLVPLFFTSCATTKVTRGEQYENLYVEKPTSILVMPPINNTNSVEAKDFLYSALYAPLCEKGYYVYSPILTYDFLQSESAYDSSLFFGGDLTMFNKVLGAEAVMFTIINEWDRNVIRGRITADVDYYLCSTKTGKTLYNRRGKIKLKTGVKTGLGLVVNLVPNLLRTTATDRVVAGRACTMFVLRDMPEGKYGSNYYKDQLFEAGEKYVKAKVSTKTAKLK